MKATKENKYSFTKQKGLDAYDKFGAPKWIKFAFKYFSKSTEKENMKPSNTIAWILGSLFLIGLFGTMFDLPWAVLLWVTMSYLVILVSLVGFCFAAVLVNNQRIRKVVKELGCSLTEWNKFVTEYKDEIK